MSEYTYIPSDETGPFKVGDAVQIHDSRQALSGPYLRIVHVGKRHVKTDCGRMWSIDKGEWIAEFRGGRPEVYPFPWIKRVTEAASRLKDNTEEGK